MDKQKRGKKFNNDCDMVFGLLALASHKSGSEFIADGFISGWSCYLLAPFFEDFSSGCLVSPMAKKNPSSTLLDVNQRELMCLNIN